MADDYSEVFELAADLSEAPAVSLDLVTKALEVTARNIKDDWRDGATIARGYAKSYAAAITYDMKGYVGFGGAEVLAEIGPVLHSTPGASAGFLEDGGGGVDGPPHHAARNAVEANEGDFERGIATALFDSLRQSVGGV